MKRVFNLLILFSLFLAVGCAAKFGPITGKKYSGTTIYKSTTLQAFSDREAKAYLREVRLAKYLQAYPETKPEMKQLLLDGQYQIGMTRDQAVVVNDSCSVVNTVTTSLGTSEQWHCIMAHQFLYFDNGKLTTVQSVS